MWIRSPLLRLVLVLALALGVLALDGARRPNSPQAAMAVQSRATADAGEVDARTLRVVERGVIPSPEGAAAARASKAGSGRPSYTVAQYSMASPG